ncbi:Hypothetical protein, putative [Bodo saltans]|uniref:Uncharacterized protein n=1 Tax=Bodo saltans TaxID=75058 RepID=A0A0S4IX16_BODSA|nr:Hypothetical protein, putative [Bodo saltans]|eukprot:CUG35180.1 Hypothetical protein, putative [Bodo saltans]
MLPPNFGPWGAPPGLFPIGALPPPLNSQNLSGHELSGVSSSSASSSSSSTSSSSSSEDNTISPELEAFIPILTSSNCVFHRGSPASSSSSEDNTISPELEAFIRSPQVQTVFSTEAVQRGALPPPPNPQNLSGHELSGVSSSSSASSSSSTSSSSSSEDNTISPELEAFIRSPQVQTVFSTEAVQRYRFYNDVDQIFTFLREAFAEEHSNIVRSLAQRLPFNALQASGSAAAAVSATTQQQGGQVQPHQQQPQQSLATAPTVHTGTITDPITSFLVEWFKTLQVHELPTVLQQKLSHSAAAAPVVPPTTLATPRNEHSSFPSTTITV